MMSTTKSLEQKIELAVEQLVREHLAACEAAAAVAVRAAFGRASRSASRSASKSPSKPSKPSRRKSARAPAPRRSREELEAVEERLYEAIRRHPGETMAVIAPVVGATGRELNRPATTLRRKGRVRSVGKRQYTRYFPMGE